MKTLILLLLITSQSLFALISIVPVEISQNAGVHGELSASLETKRGNTDKDNYKFGARVVYDYNNSFVTWGEISAEYGESSGVQDTNKAFIHLRHIHAITKEDIRLELFLQTQEDKFKSIERRFVGGAGLRFKLFEVFKDGKGYFGAGGFHEYIRYISQDPTEKNLRINTYFAYTVGLGEDSTLSYSLFFQPKIDNIKDYTKAHKLNLQLHIYKALYLNLQLSYDVDTRPATGIEKYDFYQETAFILKF